MGLRCAPFAFTEHGALMAASVLNTLRVVEVSLNVVRAFVRQRDTLAAHKELVAKLEELEQEPARPMPRVSQATKANSSRTATPFGRRYRTGASTRPVSGMRGAWRYLLSRDDCETFVIGPPGAMPLTRIY